MKKIVTNEAQVSINEIQDGDFIGIDWNDMSRNSEHNRSVVVRTEDGFASIRFDICMPDLRNTWVTTSAKEYVERALKQRNEVEAYKFSSSETLLTWLNE